MDKILLTVAYDGTRYAGWQRQKNAVSVQQVLEEALRGLFRRPLSVIGGGRTDAGVHAMGQRALIREHLGTNIPAEKLPAAVNSFLPADIRIIGADMVQGNFHPLRNPAVKTYVYSIFNSKYMQPIYRNYAAHERRELDYRAMAAACGHFVGIHDFAGFSSMGTEVKSTIREIYSLTIEKEAEMLKITAKGGGFLYNMVRIIAGTLLLAGLGKIHPDSVPVIIKSRDRTRAGKTMPAAGLCLRSIEYQDDGRIIQ